MSEINNIAKQVTAGFIRGMKPSEQTMKSKALEFAMGLMDAETAGAALASAEQIFAFLDECSHDFDLRLRALTAACTVAIRSEGDSCTHLIANARVFLAFLNGATSSASPAPCASAEPRSGVE